MIASGREVRIDPLGKIDNWTANDVTINEINGRLYVPKENGIEVADIFRDFNHRGSSSFESIGEGYEGMVYRVGSYALKEHCFLWRKGVDVVPTLRVNRALEVGLSTVAQPDKRAYHIRGIRTYGWFSPVEGSDQLLMEYVEPVATLGSRKARALPNNNVRERMYTEALRPFGIDPSWVDFDDADFNPRKPVNLIISRTPDESGRGIAVKHDVIAHPEFFEY